MLLLWLAFFVGSGSRSQAAKRQLVWTGSSLLRLAAVWWEPLDWARLSFWFLGGWDWSKKERNNQGVVAEPPRVLGRIIQLSMLLDTPTCPTSLRLAVCGHFFQINHHLPFSSSSFLPMTKHSSALPSQYKVFRVSDWHFNLSGMPADLT